LISDRWILTAAHCVVDANSRQQRAPGDVGVLLGSPQLATGGSFEFVARVVVHPEYNTTTTENDIALLELPASVDFDPITIPSIVNPVPQDGELATVAGWGATSEGGDISGLLQEVDVPVVSHNACLPFYGNALNQSSMVCAGGSREAAEDACNGDSGGPLFVPRGNQIVQAGVVSFGQGCARPGVPAVYTRVANYFDWISGIVDDPLVYDGSGEGEVVTVADPIELLAPNTRVADSVAQGDTVIYRSTGIDRILLETFQGDADLYVFNSPAFSQRTLQCRSIEEGTTTEQCFVNRGVDYFIAVAGFDDSDYALTVSLGVEQAVAVELATLQVDVPVTGNLLQDTTAVYRAESGNNATLTSITGNAQLQVFASDEFSLETLICASDEPASALDHCEYSEPEVYISVVGATDTRYSLVISTLEQTETAAPGTIAVEATANCIDTDGDGWGWDGTASCLVSASTAPADEPSLETLPCIDDDGDGWGWDGTASCFASASASSVEEPSFDTLTCIDDDGDGWGWQQPAGRPDLGQSCRVSP